jgi:iron complex transport system substrate-binding protein
VTAPAAILPAAGAPWGRRGLLAAALAAVALPGRGRRALAAPAPPVLAAIDWAMAETALGIGAIPLAMTEVPQFRRLAVEPAVPDGVIDLGLRGAPNLELLAALRPGLILSSTYYSRSHAAFAGIAPVWEAAIHLPAGEAYPRSLAVTREMGARCGREAGAEALRAATEAALAAARAELSGLSRPLYLVNPGDTRHLRCFGADSLFGEVLARLGLRNAWSGGTAYSATATVGIEALAAVPEAWIVLLDPMPPASGALQDGVLWRALPAAQAGRVVRLPPIDPFGALPAAGRFARLLHQALLAADPRR